jgi:hypothetical protein
MRTTIVALQSRNANNHFIAPQGGGEEPRCLKGSISIAAGQRPAANKVSPLRGLGCGASCFRRLTPTVNRVSPLRDFPCSSAVSATHPPKRAANDVSPLRGLGCGASCFRRLKPTVNRVSPLRGLAYTYLLVFSFYLLVY